MTVKAKMCKDCRHVIQNLWPLSYRGIDQWKFARCLHAPIKALLDDDAQRLIYGRKVKQETSYYYCSVERQQFAGSCGPDGKNWEPKP